ncbi:sensor histidine kinase [Sphingomonas sp. BAUL-RG-20F-R05-02]|uniref:ATP-binding protein n=1 Tax=Sphingomonas sp. BAUL-RG-20F-R05-02 TaxID=2914830 RepID=UPI001F573614|nr:sensor histidine kinase [Sphingomonas sp. BAUL-RG-20F-R05-02]
MMIEKGNGMSVRRGEEIDWDEGRPVASEATLLLAELQHRVSNEVACAISAMRLAGNAGFEGPRIALFERAVERLEGFGKVHGVLAARPSRLVDVGAGLHRLCRGLVAGREGLDRTRVNISVTTPPLPGGPGQRLLLIAAELIFNGIRHALVGRCGCLDIDVALLDDHVILVVSDDGPGIAASRDTSGTGLGAGIVDELVRMGDGRIERDSDSSGTVFRVTLPLNGRPPVDWVVSETVA